MTPSRFDLANAIRALSMDAVQQANSGHPGMPMGMADIAEVLWNDYLKHDPADPKWADRDRFVVSNGHGSMLLYSLLHLTGYDLPLQDLKNFRQMHSKTPGHPEVDITPGVETTTGPLGQGIANAVGMALAEAVLANEFNTEDQKLVDHYTYVFTGDGCLMEGISHEVCSLAGTLGLNKLVVFYDDNNISIDGEVGPWFGDDSMARFEAYGWQVVRNVDGHNAEEIKVAIETARASTHKPTLIQCKTIIGFGSPNKQGKESCHGAPLGPDEIKLAREQLNWPHAPFEIPAPIKAAWDAKPKGAEAHAKWQHTFEQYKKSNSAKASEFSRRIRGDLPVNWADTKDALLKEALSQTKANASRKSSKAALNALAPKLPELFGGSADLAESNCVDFAGHKPVRNGNLSGNYANYGVREFGMSAMMNGMALHGGFIPFGATFLTFSDYARNALRMAALMKLGSIFVYTHDSIGLGEDGPTHQAVEHVSSLRLMPNMHMWRPADYFETAIAWIHSIERRDGPSAMALSRQNLDEQTHDAGHAPKVRMGGYILKHATNAKAQLVATGSEVQLIVRAAQKLEEKGIAVNIVSMPCADLFLEQTSEYQDSVLPSELPALAVEAGVTLFWKALLGRNAEVLGVDTYGESAPAEQVFEHFGLTVENVVARVEKLLAR